MPSWKGGEKTQSTQTFQHGIRDDEHHNYVQIILSSTRITPHVRNVRVENIIKQLIKNTDIILNYIVTCCNNRVLLDGKHPLVSTQKLRVLMTKGEKRVEALRRVKKQIS